MSTQNYRLILTGEVISGFSRETIMPALAEVFEASVESLSDIFDGAEHPIDQILSAEDALELQTRLERIGVRSRIERAAARKVELQLRGQGRASVPAAVPKIAAVGSRSAAQPGLMNCPACGHQQMVSRRCDSCGIVFADFHRSGGQRARVVTSPSFAAGQQTPAAPPTPPPSSTLPPSHPDQHQTVWRDFDEDDEPDERFYLTIFFGEQAPRYLDACDKFFDGPKVRFKPSWHWSAVFSPFIWSLYRKMWGWSSLIFVTEVLAPMLLLIFGGYGLISPVLSKLAYLLLIANRLLWPMVLKYLYCRHARVTLARLHMMAPNYAAEIDIAGAGGVSRTSVMVGVVVSAVLGVFTWSLVDSFHDSSQLVQQQRAADIAQAREGLGITEEVDEPTSSVLGLEPSRQPTNKWVQTRSSLRVLSQAIEEWLATKGAGVRVGELDYYQLRQSLGLTAEQVSDAWDGEIQFIPSEEGYRLVSAGPDHLFGTADDLQYFQMITPEFVEPDQIPTEDESTTLE